MVDLQRKVAKGMDCVLDGRDIGSNVLPDAKYKFYITADSKVRAERRYKELAERGTPVDFDKLHEEIVQRDYNDSHREFAPLKQCDDAKLIDTSDLTIDEVVQTILNDVKKVKNMFKLLIWIILPFYKLLYLPKVKGKENLPKNSGFVVVCNHFAKVDAFMMVDLFKKRLISWRKRVVRHKI